MGRRSRELFELGWPYDAGIALPGRLDDALRVAVVKRFPGTRAGLGALGLSLLILGMLDNAALTPMASVAAADASSWAVRAGFLVIAVAGIAAAVVICYLPKIAGMRRLQRFRFARWVAEHTHCTREAWAAWLLVSFSWSLRGTAIFLLLHALAMGGASFPLALAFLVATAASAALPIAPAGAATQAGAGAAILIASGAPTTEAIAFSVALAEKSHSVLLIDLDPQGNLTMSQGWNPDEIERSMFDVLVHRLPITEIIREGEVAVAVSSIDLAGAELALSSMIGRERALEKALVPVREEYDFII